MGFVAALVVVAWPGGLGPGLVATGLGGAAATFFALEPIYSFQLRAPSDLVGLGLYAFVGIVISGLNESVRQQKNWFRETLASIGDGVIVTDKQGDVTFLNPVAEELTGWRLADALGPPVEDVFVACKEDGGAAVEKPCRKRLKNRPIEPLAKETPLPSTYGGE